MGDTKKMLKIVKNMQELLKDLEIESFLEEYGESGGIVGLHSPFEEEISAIEEALENMKKYLQ